MILLPGTRLAAASSRSFRVRCRPLATETAPQATVPPAAALASPPPAALATPPQTSSLSASLMTPAPGATAAEGPVAQDDGRYHPKTFWAHTHPKVLWQHTRDTLRWYRANRDAVRSRLGLGLVLAAVAGVVVVHVLVFRDDDEILAAADKTHSALRQERREGFASLASLAAYEPLRWRLVRAPGVLAQLIEAATVGLSSTNKASALRTLATLCKGDDRRRDIVLRALNLGVLHECVAAQTVHRPDLWQSLLFLLEEASKDAKWAAKTIEYGFLDGVLPMGVDPGALSLQPALARFLYQLSAHAADGTPFGAALARNTQLRVLLVQLHALNSFLVGGGEYFPLVRAKAVATIQDQMRLSRVDAERFVDENIPAPPESADLIAFTNQQQAQITLAYTLGALQILGLQPDGHISPPVRSIVSETSPLSPQETERNAREESIGFNLKHAETAMELHAHLEKAESIAAFAVPWAITRSLLRSVRTRSFRLTGLLMAPVRSVLGAAALYSSFLVYTEVVRPLAQTENAVVYYDSVALPLSVAFTLFVVAPLAPYALFPLALGLSVGSLTPFIAMVRQSYAIKVAEIENFRHEVAAAAAEQSNKLP